MFDAHNKAAGANAHRRHNTGTMKFSPSYGVRAGFIKDPNWPPAHMPEEGNAARRRHLRVNCSFVVRVSGSGVPVNGDLSAGGARFTLDRAAGSEVEVVAGSLTARAHVLQVIEANGRFTHRAQFVDPNAGNAVFSAVWRPTKR
jgi:hypothetical protein